MIFPLWFLLVFIVAAEYCSPRLLAVESGRPFWGGSDVFFFSQETYPYPLVAAPTDGSSKQVFENVDGFYRPNRHQWLVDAENDRKLVLRTSDKVFLVHGQDSYLLHEITDSNRFRWAVSREQTHLLFIDSAVNPEMELFSVSLALQDVPPAADPVKLSVPLSSGGSVESFQPAAGGRVVYRAQVSTYHQLYVANVDGSVVDAPLLSQTPPTVNDHVSEYAVSTDGSLAVYSGKGKANSAGWVFEAVNLTAAGLPRPTVSIGNNPFPNVQFVPDAHRIVYFANSQECSGHVGVWLASVSSSSGDLNFEMPCNMTGKANGYTNRYTDYNPMSPDGQTLVAFGVDHVVGFSGLPLAETVANVSARVVAQFSPQGSDAIASFQLTNTHLVIAASFDTEAVTELYVARLDGTDADNGFVKISGPLTNGGGVGKHFTVVGNGGDGDQTTVYFTADADTENEVNLYAVELAVSGRSHGQRVQLNTDGHQLVTHDSIGLFAVSGPAEKLVAFVSSNNNNIYNNNNLYVTCGQAGFSLPTLSTATAADPSTTAKNGGDEQNYLSSAVKSTLTNRMVLGLLVFMSISSY